MKKLKISKCTLNGDLTIALCSLLAAFRKQSFSIANGATHIAYALILTNHALTPSAFFERVSS